MCHVRLAPLVGDCIVPAPLGGDPPEVAARVLPLCVIAHGCGVCLVEEGGELGTRLRDEGVTFGDD